MYSLIIIFWWEGIDGTRILTHFYKKNNARLDPLDLITRWEEDRVQQENIDTFIFPFGFGDGGGGATREMAEVAKRVKDLEGAPRTRMESPVRFFERLEEENSVKRFTEGNYTFHGIEAPIRPRHGLRKKTG